MKAVSLFSGVGGLDLGFERAGIETVLQVEIDEFCRQVLAKHWPDVRRIADVREVIETDVQGVDVVYGGFPCQPFSQAGKRLGVADERWMWPEFERIVRAARPLYVIVENVAALVRDSAAFGRILSDLRELGFDAEWAVIPAGFVGAPHLRRRLFLVAYTTTPRRPLLSRDWPDSGSRPSSGSWPTTPLDSPSSAVAWLERTGLREPPVQRNPDGLPNRVDRLAALGNAVVPQVAELIGRRLVAMDSMLRSAVRPSGCLLRG